MAYIESVKRMARYGSVALVGLLVTVSVPPFPREARSAAAQLFPGVAPDRIIHGSQDGLTRTAIEAHRASSVHNTCLPILEMDINSFVTAPYFNASREVWEFYIWNNAEAHVDRYDVARDLSVGLSAIPVDSGGPWIAEDLDLDGEVDLFCQWHDEVRIYSAPDWRLRAKFVWPGTNVVLKPAKFQLDTDPYWEIYATPHFLFGGGYAAVIDYNPVTDSFYIASELFVPIGLAGRSAVADFDEDGRVEFITGNNEFGYELFEWQDTGLVYIGVVGDILHGNNFSAAACWPKPNGIAHALIGQSRGGVGHVYQLLEPVGDNLFTVSHRFESVGPIGIHPAVRLTQTAMVWMN